MNRFSYVVTTHKKQTNKKNPNPPANRWILKQQEKKAILNTLEWGMKNLTLSYKYCAKGY